MREEDEKLQDRVKISVSLSEILNQFQNDMKCVPKAFIVRFDGFK